MNAPRILIADDEPMVIRILRRALEGAGYVVDAVHNGEAAWQRLDDGHPDLLITDIDMPRLTGEELCKRIQAQLPERRFPICVLTSKTALEHREWSRHIDRLMFLEKPVSVRLLLARLGEHFARHVEAEAR